MGPNRDPMRSLQVTLLRRLRADTEAQDREALRRTILLGINDLAAGLQNTG